MKIRIAKLARDVDMTEFWSWSTDAQKNGVAVGLGRILNDAVAGVARPDFDSDAQFESHAMKKINTRIANLRNADRKVTVELTPEQKRVLAMNPEKLAELIALLDANQMPASDVA